MELNTIHNGDSLELLRQMPDQYVHCIVTSPPYYALRDYNCDGQIGLEKTPYEFIVKLVDVFRECKRVLRDDGTLWVNIGDSYGSSGGDIFTGFNERYDGTGIGGMKQAEIGKSAIAAGEVKKKTGLPPKNLLGIPWRLAFALQADGWILRQDIIWSKPNPMPESVTDRCTKSHEYIFLLSKSQRYFYDAEAIKQPIQDASVQRLMQDIENQEGSDRVPGKTNGKMKAVLHKNMQRTDKLHSFHASRKGFGTDNTAAINGSGVKGHSGNFNADGQLIGNGMANKRSVWTVTTMPYAEAHFATFPEKLILDCIKAGCPEDGTVLDPFMGAGTTALVARKLHRNYIGCELNPTYIKIAEKRLRDQLGFFV